jgi:rhodanese-related sulfurtransferase
MLVVSQFVALFSLIAALVGVLPSAPPQSGVPKDARAVPRISQDQFSKLHATGDVLVVDVRPAMVFDVSHIPGAISVPIAEVERQADSVIRKAARRPIVTYCSCVAEHTAAEAALQLLHRGATNVSALAGGYPEWLARRGYLSAAASLARNL